MGGFSYPDEFQYSVEGVPEGVGLSVLGIFVFVYFLIILAALAFSVVTYVLHSIGLYTIANRRGIRHSWLAWLPIGNLWMLGCISDQYQYVAKGKITNRRRRLVLLQTGLIALYVVWVLCIVAMLVTGKPVLGFWLCLFAMAIFPIIQLITRYMACYDVYRSCEPDNAVLYVVLSIVFSVTMPFFVFVCRKKDDGMPPRKQISQEPVVEEEDFVQPEEFEEE